MSEELFAPFFEQNYAKQVFALMKKGASKCDAEDAVAEAMTRAIGCWQQIENPRAWVHLVAQRCYFDLQRDRGRATTLEEALDRASSDEELALLGDEVQLALSMMRRLPVKRRVVFVAHYEGLSTGEIADLVGRPAATVRSLLRHARKQLEQEMEK